MNKNKMFTDREKQRWSLRKLTVGLSSVLLGMTLFGISGNAEAATPKVDLSQTETAKAAKSKQAGGEIAAPAAKAGDQSAQKQAAAPAKAQPAAKSAEAAETAKSASAASQKEQTPAQKTDVLNTDSVLSKGRKAEAGKAPAKTEQEQKSVKSSKPAADQTKTDKAAGSKQANPKQAADQNKQPQTKQDLNVKKLAKAAKDSKTAKELAESKQASSEPAADVNLWTTQTDSDGLELIGYNPKTDDQKANIVLPNDQDFIKAGKLTQGQSVGIKSTTMENLVKNNQPKFIGISKTNNGKVKAIDANWSAVFCGGFDNWLYNNIGMKDFDPNLTRLDLSNFDTHNITDFNHMFYDGNITSVGDLSNWDTSNAAHLDNMFCLDNNLQSVGDLSKWDVHNNGDFNHMFAFCPALQSVGDLSNWNTSTAFRFDGMFQNDPNLTSVGNLSNWKIGKVTNLAAMFKNDTNLNQTLDVSRWDTSHVNSMTDMFTNDKNLTVKVDNGSFADSLNKNEQEMLASSNLAQTKAVITNNKSILQTLVTNSSALNNVIKQISRSYEFDKPNGQKVTGTQTIEAVEEATVANGQVIGTSGNYSAGNGFAAVDAPKVDGYTPNQDVEAETPTSSEIASWNNADHHIVVTYRHTAADLSLWTTTQGANSLIITGYKPNTDEQRNTIVVPNSQDYINAGKLSAGQEVDLAPSVVHSIVNNCKPEYFGISRTAGGKVVATGNDWETAFTGSQWGGGTNLDQVDPNLTYVDLANLDIHTYAELNNVDEDIGWMFWHASKLKTVDLTGWNTSKVNDMGSMFFEDPVLTEIKGIGDLDVSHVTSMIKTFAGDTSLQNLDLSRWRTSSLGRIKSIFEGDTSLRSIGNLGNWDVSNVYEVSGAFKGDKSLTYIGDLSNWNTSKFGENFDEGMSEMFKDCSSLTNIGRLDNWDVSHVTTLKDAFSGDSSLQSLGDLSKWNIGNVNTLKGTFYHCSSLKNLGDLNNWNLSNVTDLTSAFEGCTNLENVGDLSNWDLSKVTALTSMFNKCSSLTNLGNIGKWDVSNVSNMAYTFNGCTNLTHLDLSNWNTRSLNSLYDAFSNDPNLISLGDLSNWNTSNLQWLYYTFQGDTHLKNLGDLSNWNVSKAQDLNSTFLGCSSLTNIGNLANWNVSNVTDMFATFSGCSNLTTLGDLSGWNLSNVTTTQNMFNGDAKITNLGNLNNWQTGNVTNMNRMFAGMTNLQNMGHLNHWNTSNVTDMGEMFLGDANLTNVGDLSNWQTGNVTTMKEMFSGDSVLSSLGDLSNWQTGNVTNMASMFADDFALSNIGLLSNWDVSQVQDMSGMFTADRALQKLDLSRWNTAKVTNMGGMFYGASALTDLGNLNNWDVSQVQDMETMFAGDYKLSKLNLSHWNTGNVTKMGGMFQFDGALTDVGDLSDWDTSKVTDTSYMFMNSGLKKLNISNWDLRQDAKLSLMFDDLQSPAVIQMNNVKLPANSFKAIDFESVDGLKPLIVLSNVDSLQALNNESFVDSKGRNCIGHDLANNFWFRVPDDKNETVFPIDFVYKDENDLQQRLGDALSTPTIKERLINVYNSSSSDAIKNYIGKDAQRLIDPKFKVDAKAILADPSILNTLLNVQLHFANVETNTIEFVDDDSKDAQGNPSVVGTPQTISGHAGDTVDFNKAGLSLNVPTIYKLADGQKLPTSYTFTTDSKQIPVQIHLVHQTKQIDKNSIPDGAINKDKSSVTKANFEKTVTRTIVAEVPDHQGGTQEIVQEIQKHTFTRTGTYDEVTGVVTYNDDYDGPAIFNAFSINQIAGYTSEVDGKAATQILRNDNVTADMQNSKVIITYKANAQHIDYQLVDDDSKDAAGNPNKVGEAIEVDGVTDGTIDPSSKITVPAGFDVVTTIPTSVKLSADNKDLGKTVKIHLKHKKDAVTDVSKLTHNVTRTITITKPGKAATTQTQTVHFTRTGSYDEVTENTSYSDWTVDGSNVWVAVAVPSVDGYHAVIKDRAGHNLSAIGEQTVNGNSANEKITVTYERNSTPLPPTETATATVTISVESSNGSVEFTKIFTQTGNVGQWIDFGSNNSVVKDWITNFLAHNPNYVLIKAPSASTSVSARSAMFTVMALQMPSPAGNVSPAPKPEDPEGPIDPNSLDWPHLFGRYQAGDQQLNFEFILKQKAETPPTNPGGDNTDTGEQTIVARFVDDDNSESQVGRAIVLTGWPGETVAVHLLLPKLYQLAAGQILPTSYTFKAAGNADLVIHLVHIRQNVYETKTQAKAGRQLHLRRDGVEDVVTGQVVWGPWKVLSQTALPGKAEQGQAAHPRAGKLPAQAIQPGQSNGQKLPQTGDKDTSALGIGLAIGASLLGLAGADRKRKHE